VKSYVARKKNALYNHKKVGGGRCKRYVLVDNRI